jgi:pimeloyl-ACP methyl ester carboxylesterase
VAQIRANGIAIEAERMGERSNSAIVLIRGLGTQLIQWPDRFVHRLVERDFQLVMFDNRDVGLSEKFESAGAPNLAALMAGSAEPAYQLTDMAEDVCGILDVLEIERAHIVGMSMGGMIAQLVASAHPERTRSLVSIMSSSGRPDLPPPTPEAAEALTSQPEKPDDRESIIEHGIRTRRVIGSPGFPTDDTELRRQIETSYDRSYYPQGVGRQLAAVVKGGSRVEQLKTISAPTLVIHGADDLLVSIEAGRDTAQNIPGAQLEVIEGMGHELSPGLEDRLADLIADCASKADAARA